MVLLYSFRISICKVFHPKMPFLTPNNTNIYRNVLSRVIVLYSGGNIKAAHYTHNTFVSCYCLDMDNHTLIKTLDFVWQVLCMYHSLLPMHYFSGSSNIQCILLIHFLRYNESYKVAKTGP